jgi:tight adherence protein C
MNEQILQLQLWLAERGAPDWLLRPMSWLTIACGLAVLLVIVRLLFKRSRKPADPLTPNPSPTRGEGNRNSAIHPAGGGVFGAWTEALASQIPESEKERKEFAAVLKQAGLYSATARNSVYAYRFLLMVFPLLCAGLLAVFAPREHWWRYLIGGGVLAAILSIIPRLFVWYRRRVRLRQINGGLADMLDMLSMCLGGGMSISASLDHVAKNLVNYPALGQELLIMKRQAEVGSLRMALTDWASRVDTLEVRQVATLLTRGDALGTALSGSLMDQADHFRTARKQLATLQANRMPVFLTFPLLFCFAPAVLIILMSPAFLQLSDFLNPQNANNPLAGNQTIDTRRIADQIGALDQSLPALQPPPTRP